MRQSCDLVSGQCTADNVPSVIATVELSLLRVCGVHTVTRRRVVCDDCRQRFSTKSYLAIVFIVLSHLLLVLVNTFKYTHAQQCVCCSPMELEHVVH